MEIMGFGTFLGNVGIPASYIMINFRPLMMLLSLDMAKLYSEKIVQETNHRWRSSLCSKEDMARPVIEVGGGTFLIPSALVLVPSTSTSLASRCPDTPKVAPMTPDPDQYLMVFD